jgi:PAS domain S-box-containing protein
MFLIFLTIIPQINFSKIKVKIYYMFAESELELLVESMPQLVWTKSPEGNRKFLNKKWVEYTGLTRDNKDWDWTSVIHPEDHDKTVNIWNESLVTGKFFEFQCRLKRKDGTFRWHLARAIPVADDYGHTTVWVGTCTDIHETRMREKELEVKNIELSKINTDLDNFVYTASHDLKLPISNLEGLVYALKHEACYEEGGEETILLDMVGKSINRLKSTIDDLTEITKIQKDLNTDIEEASFVEVLEEVKGDITHFINETGATITTDFKVSHVSFSHRNLKSIIYNLITNAIKFHLPEQPPKVLISTYKSDGFIVLAVKDNGIGIAASKMKNIFAMFSRLNASIEGTGIGLYIIKRIIENGGGRIEVESEIGKGSTFKVYFPEKHVDKKSI